MSRRTTSSSPSSMESSESSWAPALRVVEVKEPPVDPPAEGRGEGEVLNGGGRAEGTGADDPRESEDEPRRRPRGGTVRSSRLAVSKGRASRGSGSVGNR